MTLAERPTRESETTTFDLRILDIVPFDGTKYAVLQIPHMGELAGQAKCEGAVEVWVDEHTLLSYVPPRIGKGHDDVVTHVTGYCPCCNDAVEVNRVDLRFAFISTVEQIKSSELQA
jgi:hypothetical protein